MVSLYLISPVSLSIRGPHGVIRLVFLVSLNSSDILSQTMTPVSLLSLLLHFRNSCHVSYLSVHLRYVAKVTVGFEKRLADCRARKIGARLGHSSGYLCSAAALQPQLLPMKTFRKWRLLLLVTMGRHAFVAPSWPLWVAHAWASPSAADVLRRVGDRLNLPEFVEVTVEASEEVGAAVRWRRFRLPATNCHRLLGCICVECRKSTPPTQKAVRVTVAHLFQIGRVLATASAKGFISYVLHFYFRGLRHGGTRPRPRCGQPAEDKHLLSSSTSKGSMGLDPLGSNARYLQLSAKPKI